jgi:hypothetical protein
MRISLESIFLLVEDVIKENIFVIFNFSSFNLGDGLKYLGFFLKPNNYCISDWKWILSRIE